MDKIVPSLLSRDSDSIEKFAAAPLRALPTGSELSFLSLTTSSGDGGGEEGGIGQFLICGEDWGSLYRMAYSF
jgi:hypothetical protein